MFNDDYEVINVILNMIKSGQEGQGEGNTSQTGQAGRVEISYQTSGEY